MDRFENYSNFNNEKRINLVLSYNKSCPFCPELLSDKALDQFESFLIGSKSDKFNRLNTDDHLIDTIIQYSFLYLEEYNYDLKTKGLSLLEHLIKQATCNQLNYNLRSKLIYNCLERYVNDKENLLFMEQSIKVTCMLLNIIEPKISVKEHCYRQHSIIIESLMNNAYMTTNTAVKLIYYSNFVNYLCQMDIYSCRHLEKMLTIAFDCLDSTQINLNLDQQENLLNKSLELIECLTNVCNLRIHIHSKKVINFLIKLIYLYSQSVDNSNLIKSEHPSIIQRSIYLIETLFRNKLVKGTCYEEFSQLRSEKNLNSTFMKLIENI